MIEEAQLSLDELKRFFTFNNELGPPVQEASTITEVMQVVQQHSSYINCAYLKALAGYFNIPRAMKEIDEYLVFVDEFCQHTLTQHSYVASFLTDPSRHSLSSETITFKLDWKPKEKTLANIQAILEKTFKSLASHIHIVVVGGGCVMVTCYAPQYLMGALVRLAQESKEMLVENGVTYLSMGYAVLLDNSAQEKVKRLPLTLNLVFYVLSITERQDVHTRLGEDST